MKRHEMDIPELILEARVKLNMTQEAFGAHLGVRQGTVGNWERGHQPTRANLRRIKQFLQEKNLSVLVHSLTMHLKRAHVA